MYMRNDSTIVIMWWWCNLGNGDMESNPKTQSWLWHICMQSTITPDSNTLQCLWLSLQMWLLHACWLALGKWSGYRYIAPWSNISMCNTCIVISWDLKREWQKWMWVWRAERLTQTYRNWADMDRKKIVVLLKVVNMSLKGDWHTRLLSRNISKTEKVTGDKEK